MYLSDDFKQELSRRKFLHRAIVILGGMIGMVLSGIGIGYFISPVLGKKREDWVDLGPVAAIALDVPVKLEFVERRRDSWVTNEKRSSVWVLTSNGKDFIAFDPHCTHLGCPYRWDEVKQRFLCPCHNAVFAADGRVVSGPPPRALDRFPVRVKAGRLSIRPQVEEKV